VGALAGQRLVDGGGEELVAADLDRLAAGARITLEPPP